MLDAEALEDLAALRPQLEKIALDRIDVDAGDAHRRIATITRSVG